MNGPSINAEVSGVDVQLWQLLTQSWLIDANTERDTGMSGRAPSHRDLPWMPSGSKEMACIGRGCSSCSQHEPKHVNLIWTE